MMDASLATKVALARAVGAVSRRGGRGGTSLPGKLLVRLDSDAPGRLAARLPRGTALVSATNGKTTTAAMAARILEGDGVALVHNRAGANMGGGIATSLLQAARRGETMTGELGLFEVDEFWLERIVGDLHPRVLLLGNLFRDQLDRYGELDAIVDRWSALVRRPDQRDLRLVLNADDPLVADLGREREHVVYFGVEDDSLALDEPAHAADAKHCRRCGAPYGFEAVYLGHLGRYSCANCGQSRPAPTIVAEQVTLAGVHSARFVLRTAEGSAPVSLPLPGLYNVYNALAAAALATELGVGLQRVVAGLEGMRAAFGRAETLSVDGRQLRILLIKNPVGATEVLRTLALEPGRHDLLAVLNDRIADGRDVSWVWDADFELLAERVRRVTCSGTRAAELALRLKYAGVPEERIVVEGDLPAALDRAVGDRDGDAGTLYVLPTYTAMLALREDLAARGLMRSSWE